MRVNTDALEGARYDESYSGRFIVFNSAPVIIKRAFAQTLSIILELETCLEQEETLTRIRFHPAEVWPGKGGGGGEGKMGDKGEEEMHHACKYIRLADWCIYSRYSMKIKFYFYCSKPQSSANVPLLLIKAINN